MIDKKNMALAGERKPAATAPAALAFRRRLTPHDSSIADWIAGQIEEEPDQEIRPAR